jgi:hypothetical protein
VTGGLAIAIAVGINVGAAVTRPDSTTIVLFVGGFGTAALTIAVFTGLDTLVAPGVGFVMVAAAVGVSGDDEAIELAAVGYGLACFLMAELAHRSLEERARVRLDPAGRAPRRPCARRRRSRRRAPCARHGRQRAPSAGRDDRCGRGAVVRRPRGHPIVAPFGPLDNLGLLTGRRGEGVGRSAGDQQRPAGLLFPQRFPVNVFTPVVPLASMS